MSMTTTTTNNPPQGVQTAGEREFALLMLAYYRRAGRAAAWSLADRMSIASMAGCYREDHVALVREALAALPTAH